MRNLCNSKLISVYVCKELISEFSRVSSLEKIRKYVSVSRVKETVNLMELSCINISIKHISVLSNLRDDKDLFLLSLADTIQADYILTGDKDLLTLQFHNQTKIVTYNEFIELQQAVDSDFE